jgi:phage replication-related protein YjqB (UPF0714/DUF867 family)
MNFTDAWRHDETTETLWTNPETEVAILAPHAGDIEFNTEFAAGQLHKLLRKAGYHPTTWMYHGFGENAFDEYHVSSNYLEFTQFDALSRLQDRRFRFGVSFHIHEAGYVGVGGRIGEGVRSAVADRLTERLPNSKEVRYRHDEMKNKGRKESNIVNRITESGDDGLQIEMTPKTSYNYWKRVARSVRDVYVELL